MEGIESFDFFFSLLSNEQHKLKNIAAFNLKEIGDSRAVDSLFNIALNEENIGKNGSMLYALSGLDCSRKFKELFQILFYHDYEAKAHAYNILSEQEFEFSKEDLIEIRDEWAAIKDSPELLIRLKGSKEMVQDAIDQYLYYLENES